MKILMLAQNRLSRKLGGPKVVLEVGDALRALGCDVTILGTDDVARELGEEPTGDGAKIASQFDRFLRRCSGDFDVVDYDHGYLPFARSRYSANTLMVARSVLLTLHLREIRLPSDTRWLRRLAQRVRWRKYWLQGRNALRRAEQTLREADLINVSNRDDVAFLTRRLGVTAEKIVEIPFGIPSVLAKRLSGIEAPPKSSASIIFVGTFDYRKGCLDLPRILTKVRATIPEATLTLLGARGLFSDPQKILSFFPEVDRSAVRLVMEYEPDDLPDLLSGHTAGVFPSYLEGFGIGVVEMMAAGIPVVAYAVPGPRSILDTSGLVAAGDRDALSVRILDFLAEDTDARGARRTRVQAQAQNFLWSMIGERTLATYEAHLSELRNASRGALRK